MSSFNIRAWYKGAVAAAAGLLGVGAVAGNPALLTFGLGLLLLGLGEWINHPFQTQVIPPTFGFPNGGIAEGEARRLTLLGLIFDAIGLSLLAVGLFRLAWPVVMNG